MKIDFTTLPMMDLRSAPGEILDRVAKDGEVFIVERNGQAKACIVPVSFLLPDISSERIAAELKILSDRNQSYRLTINERKELEITFLEVVAGEQFPVMIILPHGYPTNVLRIYIIRLPADAPMTWPDGSLSIYGNTFAWNAKLHNVGHALDSARLWIKQFMQWRATGHWVK